MLPPASTFSHNFYMAVIFVYTGVHLDVGRRLPAPVTWGFVLGPSDEQGRVIVDTDDT